MRHWLFAALLAGVLMIAQMPSASAKALERATLGGGCFWCLEAAFEELKGVESVVSGYAGGHSPKPSYQQVCGGRTGHAEVVQVAFDPAAISYRELLRAFFVVHDPTTKDRQGPDVGSQYRSIILAHSPAQAAAARAVVGELESSKAFGAPIVTELVPLKAFYPAEAEHQDYFAKHPNQPYCVFVVAPKVEKLKKQFLGRLKR